MKKYIIANWKSNKNPKEAILWLDEVHQNFPLNSIDKLECSVCVPYIDIPYMYKKIKENNKIKLGAQNISAFGDGPYTGEISGRLIEGLVSYVLVGHSERRKNYNENDQIVAEKTIRALESGITPIVCISEEVEIANWNGFIDNKIDPNKKKAIIFAFEPLNAIGTGNAEDPLAANEFINGMKQKYSIEVMVYGGSVDQNNINLFLNQPSVSGILIGSASLSAEKFLKVIENAASK